MDLKNFKKQGEKQGDFEQKVSQNFSQNVTQEKITKYQNPILCPYKNQPRSIHPEVCIWHQEMNDPECQKINCKRLKKEVRL